MSNPPRSAARRLRRRIARWAAPELEAELAQTRRKLKAARRKLRERDAPPPLPAEIEAVISAVRAEHLTYLKRAGLRDLAGRTLELEQRGAEGLIIEAGTARGGSAIVMAAAKAPERPMKVYDVFGMIPPPSEQDGPDVHARYEKITGGEARGPGGETYYGYRDDLYSEVTESFARHGVPALRVAAADHEALGAALGEGAGDGLPEALRAAGDDGDGVLELEFVRHGFGFLGIVVGVGAT